ncbi:hypothetical protein J6590_007282, partial [Homalodisca vitripennis]
LWWQAWRGAYLCCRGTLLAIQFDMNRWHTIYHIPAPGRAFSRLYHITRQLATELPLPPGKGSLVNTINDELRFLI